MLRYWKRAVPLIGRVQPLPYVGGARFGIDIVKEKERGDESVYFNKQDRKRMVRQGWPLRN